MIKLAKTLGACFAFCISTHANAQSAPWDDLPYEGYYVNYEGRQIPVYLTLDTLPNEKCKVWGESPFINPLHALLYPDSLQVIGYGYKEANGKPFDVWRYYTITSTGYMLYCEGHYEELTPANLYPPFNIQLMPWINDVKYKNEYLAPIRTRFLYTGEWRFYENGKLASIIVMDDKVTMSMDIQPGYDAEGNLNEQMVVVGYCDKRLAGDVQSSIHFTPDGLIKKIKAQSPPNHIQLCCRTLCVA